MNRNYFVWTVVIFCGMPALGFAIAAAQNSHPAKAPRSDTPKATGLPSRGKLIFEKRCAICHYAATNEKKIGPGLKGIGERGTFTVNGNKVTTESLTTWIENGDSLMPPFKAVLDAAQIKDIVAYIKTL